MTVDLEHAIKDLFIKNQFWSHFPRWRFAIVNCDRASTNANMHIFIIQNGLNTLHCKVELSSQSTSMDADCWEILSQVTNLILYRTPRVVVLYMMLKSNYLLVSTGVLGVIDSSIIEEAIRITLKYGGHD